MFTGKKEVIANLDKYFKRASDSVDDALLEIGERGVTITKKNTPVDKGRLRNSMSYSTNKKAVGSGKDSIKKHNEKNTVAVGTNVIYAPSVEYLSKNGSAGFMLKSFKQMKSVSKAIFESFLKKSLK